jgi:hypothetical protein
MTETDYQIQRIQILAQQKLLKECLDKLCRMGNDYETADLIKRIEKQIGEYDAD